MELLMMTIAVGLVIYLMRRDIFISNFRLRIRVLGLNLEVKAKEKNCPPSKKDSSNLK